METDVEAGCSKGNWQRLGLEPYFTISHVFRFSDIQSKQLESIKNVTLQQFGSFYEVYDDEGHIVTNYHVIECLATQMRKTFKLLQSKLAGISLSRPMFSSVLKVKKPCSILQPTEAIQLCHCKVH